MELAIQPAEVVPFGLRAMKMVASADGDFGNAQRWRRASVGGQ
jgi:hypothetical protein